jgi:hypothetical protein
MASLARGPRATAGGRALPAYVRRARGSVRNLRLVQVFARLDSPRALTSARGRNVPAKG